MKWMILLITLLPLLSFGQNSISFLNTDIRNIDAQSKIYVNNRNTPFEVIRGMIYVKGHLNNVEGNFILDTGAPTLVVNKKEHLLASTSASSIAGTFSVSSLKVEQFSWAGTEQTKMDALAVDISHLEKASNREILGLIGYNSLKNYELYIDAQQKHLSLHKANKNVLHKVAKPLFEIPFVLNDHLPVITVVIGAQKIRLGLDTGAAVNVLDASLMQEIPNHLLENIHKEEMQGVDQVIITIEAATLKQTQIEDASFDNMKYLFTDLSLVNQGTELKIDGLLGAPFFQKMKCSINYKKGKIYVWEIL